MTITFKLFFKLEEPNICWYLHQGIGDSSDCTLLVINLGNNKTVKTKLIG